MNTNTKQLLLMHDEDQAWEFPSQFDAKELESRARKVFSELCANFGELAFEDWVHNQDASFGPKVSSAQAFLAPDLEYRWLTGERWQAGSLLKGYFNLNFGDASEFNLQHYNPGFYVESVVGFTDGERIGRVQYDYSYDLFDTQTFGDRHALTSSLSVVRDCGKSTVLFWTVDVTDFRDDGATPSLTSLDGWTNTIGLSRAYESKDAWWSLVEMGADFQVADLQGSNFTYRGVMLYVNLEIPAWYDVLVLPEFGWGYRQYPDSTLVPSRDENIWHGGISLRKQWDDHWSLLGTASYDSFDSENVLFTANRYTAGMSVLFEL